MPVMFLTTTAADLSSIVTADMVGGVLNQIMGLLPVVLPAMITFLGIR